MCLVPPWKEGRKEKNRIKHDRTSSTIPLFFPLFASVTQTLYIYKSKIKPINACSSVRFRFSIMKSKSICFCIRIGSQKSKENELGDAEKLSEQKTSDHHHKSRKKGKSRGHAAATPAGDVDGGVPGGGTADAGVTAAVANAVHMSATSANEGGSSHGHGGGDSGGGDGGG